jgi:hypothetical protein
LAQALHEGAYATALTRSNELANAAYSPSGGTIGGFETIVSGGDKTPGAILAATEKWLADHADIPSFLTVFLGDVDAEGGEALAAFLRATRDSEAGKRQCVILAALRGTSATATDDPLAEPALHVPLVVYAPDLGRGKRSELVSLEDVPAMAAAIAGVQIKGPVTGRDPLNALAEKRPVSVVGEGELLTLRTKDFRFALRPADGTTRLYRVGAGTDWWRTDVALKQLDTVERYRKELENFSRTHGPAN